METLPHELQTRVLYYALDEAWTLGHICPTLGEALLEKRLDGPISIVIKHVDVASVPVNATFGIARETKYPNRIEQHVAPATYREFLNDSKPKAVMGLAPVVGAHVNAIERKWRLPPLKVLRALTATSHALRDAFMPFWCDIYRQIAAEFLRLEVAEITDMTPSTALLAINDSLRSPVPPPKLFQ